MKQTDLNHPSKSSANNLVWNGSKVSIFGARNETVAFQLILEAAGSGASDVNVRLDTLRLNGGSYVIANGPGATDPTSYVGRRIELFVEHYTNVTQRSPFIVGMGMWNARPLPDEQHLGWVPDALVPFEAPVKTPAHGQGGAPFSIAGGRVQGVWVDVYIPKDAPAGNYSGLMAVTEGATVKAQIPVELQVYNFALPDTTHQRTFFSWNSDLIVNRYGVKEGSAAYWTLFRKFMNLAHRHRISLIDGHRSLPDFDRNLGGYYTGDYYRPEFGYEGPGEGTGDLTYSIGTYDLPKYGAISGFAPETAEGWQKASNEWEQWFLSHAPSVLRFKYLEDEGDVKDSTVVARIKNECTWIKENPGVGRNLHRFFSKEWVFRGFEDYVDFWALSSSPGIKMQDLRDLKPKGNLFCSYNGTRPMWGNMEVIDGFATDNRVNPWICKKYGIDLLFFWTTSFYAEQLPPSPNAKNVWDENYLPSGQPYGTIKSFGAGMMFYPGNDIQYSADNRGIDGPIACIRMKNLRRGLQDYEYLVVADGLGLPTSDIVNEIVPHALDDYGDSYTSALGPNQQPTYPQQGYVYEDARRRLANRIAPQTNPGVPVPTGSLEVSPDSLPVGGGNVTLTWRSNNATEASIDHNVGRVETSGSTTINVKSSTTFTLTLKGDGGFGSFTGRVSVALPPPPAGNSVTNSGFEDGTTSWWAFSDGSAQFSLQSPSYDGSTAAKFAIAKTGTNVQVYQPGLRLEPNTLYRLSFAAYCNTAHGMDISLSRHDAPYTDYGLASRKVELTGAWGVYSIDFTTKNFTDTVSNGRLRLWFAGYSAAGDEYYLDNITLVKLGNQPPPPNPTLSAPVLLSPPPEASGMPLTTEFDWEPASLAARYQVEVAKDRAFLSKVTVQIVQGTNLTVRLPDYGTSYFWKVVSIDSVLHTISSEVRRFSTEPAVLAQPSYSIPGGAAAPLSVEWTLHWSPVAGASRYHVQVAPDSLFLSLTVNDSMILDTTKVISGLQEGARYFLRMRAVGSNGESPFSAVTAFSTAHSTTPSVITYTLEQNFPNPFNPRTTIRYAIPDNTHVRMSVYSITGQLVTRLVDADQMRGRYEVVWDGKKLASGVYFCLFHAGSFSRVLRLILLK